MAGTTEELLTMALCLYESSLCKHRSSPGPVIWERPTEKNSEKKKSQDLKPSDHILTRGALFVKQSLHPGSLGTGPKGFPEVPLSLITTNFPILNSFYITGRPRLMHFTLLCFTDILVGFLVCFLFFFVVLVANWRFVTTLHCQTMVRIF